MLPDDVYRSRLEAAIAGLRYWIPTVADVARATESEGPGYWKLSVVPDTDEACPFELVLRHDQKHDLVIGSETFEDLPTPNLEAFAPLAQAISDGRVVRCCWRSAMTDIESAVETIVTLADGREWSRVRYVTHLVDDNPDGFIATEHCYVPYRLGKV